MGRRGPGRAGTAQKGETAKGHRRRKGPAGSRRPFLEGRPVIGHRQGEGQEGWATAETGAAVCQPGKPVRGLYGWPWTPPQVVCGPGGQGTDARTGSPEI